MTARHGRKALGALLPLLAAGLSLTALHAPAAAVEIPPFYTKIPPKGTLVDILSDTAVFDGVRDIGTWTGNVKLVYGPYVLHAPKVVYERRNDKLFATGHVTIKEPRGNVLVTDYIQSDIAFRNGFARNLRLLMTNDATLKAKSAVYRDGYLTTYRDVRYTRCKTCVLEGETPLWEIHSDKAVHDKHKGRVYHTNMTMRMAGVPVFWLPWFSHPDPDHPRATGFLTPSFGYAEQLGFRAEIPYFINLAPSYDVTLIPTVFSDQGLLARAVWRQRLASGIYTIDAGAIRQLKPGKITERDGDRKWRGYVHAKGDFRLNSRWEWGFDGAWQTDDSMMDQYGVDGRDIIESKVWISGLDGRNHLDAKVSNFDGRYSFNRHFPYAALDLDYSYTWHNPILGGQLSYASHVYSLYRKEEHTPFTAVQHAKEQTRAISELIWSRRMVSSAGLVATPFARLRSDIYYNRRLPDPAVPGGLREKELTTRLLPLGGIDLRWPFARSGSLGQHVISPVAQLMAARDEVKAERIGNEDAISLFYSANNLFLHDRFSGYDRYEGGVRANVGLLYSVYFTGGGFLRASIGQSYHLAGENSFQGNSGLQDDVSDIVAAVAFNPNPDLRFSWQGRFDAKDFTPHNQVASATARWGKLSSSLYYYRFEADPRHGYAALDEKVSGRLGWQFTDAFSINAGLSYDIDADYISSRSIGLSYNCDCFRLSMQYTQNLDADSISEHVFFLSVEFVTLGKTTMRHAFKPEDQ